MIAEVENFNHPDRHADGSEGLAAMPPRRSGRKERLGK